MMRGDVFLPDLSGAFTSEEFQRMIKKMFCLYKTDSEEYYSSTSVVCVSADKAKLEDRIKQEEASYEAALSKYLLNEQIKKDLKEIVETLPKNCMKMPAPLRKVKGNMTSEERKQYKNEKGAHALLMREYSDSMGEDLERRQEEAARLYYETNSLFCAANSLSVESLKEIVSGFHWRPEKHTFHIEEVEEI